MHKKRPSLARLPVFGLALAACVAQAASLGVGAPGATLGQSLDYAVAVRLDAGETLSAECVDAEVSLGDRRLLPAMVRVLVAPAGADAARLRVLTSQVVDEPLVSVQVALNCGSRVSRRYLVLADPPAVKSTATAAPAASPAGAMPEALPLAADAPAGSAADVSGALAAVAQAAPEAAGVQPAVPPLRARRATLRAAPASSAIAEGSVQRVSQRTSAAPKSTRAQRRAEARAARRRLAAEARVDAPRRAAAFTTTAALAIGPRLQLDAALPLVAGGGNAVDQALEAVAQAAVAARASASAASAAADRIAALERTVEQMRGEARSSREQSAQLREQIARSEGAGTWTWPLVAAAATLAALAGWLGLRLAAARRENNQSWQRAARLAREGEIAAAHDGDAADDQEAAPPRGSRLAEPSRPARTAPIPFVSSGLDNTLPPAGGRTRSTHAWPPPAPSEHDWEPDAAAGSAAAPEPAPRLRVVSRAASPGSPASPSDGVPPMQATMPLAAGSRGDAHGSGQARDVSIEELLDLEQQAEFFVVLGQDEAAVDLLVEHLRHTGGGSPLPYLKLLEIYRRRGDRSDYERMRARFNHRFNAYAPEWEVDLQSGRSLADYAGVLARLQQVWPRPLDSMAELESLLFRKTRGELFDLPAYREVLFLYALARDLLDRESADTGFVDLLLPLADGGDFSSTSPAPFLDLGRDAAPGRRADFEERPTAPVDLDLTLDSDRPASIFDPLHERTPPRRR